MFPPQQEDGGLYHSFVAPSLLVLFQIPSVLPKQHDQRDKGAMGDLIREIRRIMIVGVDTCDYIWVHAWHTSCRPFSRCSDAFFQLPGCVDGGKGERWRGRSPVARFHRRLPVFLLVRVHLTVVLDLSPITKHTLVQTLKWNHMFPDGPTCEHGLSENTCYCEKQPWESPFSNIFHQQNTASHTEPQEVYGWGMRLLCHLFTQPDALSDCICVSFTFRYRVVKQNTVFG